MKCETGRFLCLRIGLVIGEKRLCLCLCVGEPYARDTVKRIDEPLGKYLYWDREEVKMKEYVPNHIPCVSFRVRGLEKRRFTYR